MLARAVVHRKSGDCRQETASRVGAHLQAHVVRHVQDGVACGPNTSYRVGAGVDLAADVDDEYARQDDVKYVYEQYFVKGTRPISK